MRSTCQGLLSSSLSSLSGSPQSWGLSKNLTNDLTEVRFFANTSYMTNTHTTDKGATMNATKTECRYADRENCFGKVAHRIFGTSTVAHGEVCEKHKIECERSGMFTIVALPDFCSVRTARLKASNAKTVTHLLYPENPYTNIGDWEAECGIGHAHFDRLNGKPLSAYNVRTITIDFASKKDTASICRACLKKV